MRSGDNAILVQAHKTMNTILVAGTPVVVFKTINDNVGVYYQWRGEATMTIVPRDSLRPTKTYEVLLGGTWVPAVRAEERKNDSLYANFLDGSGALATKGFWRVRN